MALRHPCPSCNLCVQIPRCFLLPFHFSRSSMFPFHGATLSSRPCFRRKSFHNETNPLQRPQIMATVISIDHTVFNPKIFRVRIPVARGIEQIENITPELCNIVASGIHRSSAGVVGHCRWGVRPCTEARQAHTAHCTAHGTAWLVSAAWKCFAEWRSSDYLPPHARSTSTSTSSCSRSTHCGLSQAAVPSCARSLRGAPP